VPINLYLRNERGEEVDGAAGDYVLEELILPLEDQVVAEPRFLDPYGDTVFNWLQARVFEQELLSRRDEVNSEAKRRSVDRIIGLARRCGEGGGLYLWFIGTEPCRREGQVKARDRVRRALGPPTMGTGGRRRGV
jgi:hypothetical protein